MSQQEVASLVGDALAQAWQQMSVAEFTQKYSVNVVAGSMEKPNSVFKKKEAIEVARAVGQFARAAPASVTKIMLRVLEQAFTEINVKKEDWESIDQEMMASMQKGVSAQGQPGRPAAQGADAQALMDRARRASPAAKQRVMEMSNAGATPQDILSFINGQTGAQ